MRDSMWRKEERERELEYELKRIMKMLRTDEEIRSILLFGSLARGDINRTSDIDMIIVKETEKRFLDRPDEIYSTLVPDRDILVYTPEEFEAKVLEVEKKLAAV